MDRKQTRMLAVAEAVINPCFRLPSPSEVVTFLGNLNLLEPYNGVADIAQPSSAPFFEFLKLGRSSVRVKEREVSRQIATPTFKHFDNLHRQLLLRQSS